MVQLHQQYRESGFEILGFPCNQFGVISGQETKSPSEIRQFVTSKFGVEFPMMEKIEVNGSGTHPVYSLLKNDGPKISWNFSAYFLVVPSPEGVNIARFNTNPDKLEPLIQEALAKQ
eukprot:TRINITY_DN5903_c0_g1_i6.p1 TRINITY_DN5903_c0_g1~~TRINITY_DN5903_c0_g1_i6.p1  ORF type:complete len:117 (-),score=24.06 TRINITY_DN5903_c0_g1_i6:402-752(-)